MTLTFSLLRIKSILSFFCLHFFPPLPSPPPPPPPPPLPLPLPPAPPHAPRIRNTHTAPAIWFFLFLLFPVLLPFVTSTGAGARMFALQLIESLFPLFDFFVLPGSSHHSYFSLFWINSILPLSFPSPTLPPPLPPPPPPHKHKNKQSTRINAPAVRFFVISVFPVVYLFVTSTGAGARVFKVAHSILTFPFSELTPFFSFFCLILFPSLLLLLYPIFLDFTLPSYRPLTHNDW